MCTKARKFFIFLLSFGLVGFLCHKATDGFCISNLLTAQKHLESSLPSPLLKRFSYLGSGGTCYAFESDDKKEVIKFFKKHHFFKMGVFEGFPSISWLYFAGKEQKEKKWLRVWQSSSFAQQFLQEECGLIAWGILPSEVRITLIDRLKIEHVISEKGLYFVLQKKGMLAKEYFNALLKEGKKEEAKAAIQKIFHLFSCIEKKGFSILDPRIETNIAFYEGSPLFIDVGCFVKTPPDEIAQKNLKNKYRSLKSFSAFLEKLDSDLHLAFEEEKQQFLHRF